MNRTKELVIYIAIVCTALIATALLLALAYKDIELSDIDADTQIQVLESRVSDLTTRVEKLEKNQDLCAWMERGVKR